MAGRVVYSKFASAEADVQADTKAGDEAHREAMDIIVRKPGVRTYNKGNGNLRALGSDPGTPKQAGGRRDRNQKTKSPTQEADSEYYENRSHTSLPAKL